MSQSYPLSLSSLTEREAIVDTLYRAIIGCDRHDLELFTSAWAGEDVVFEIHDDEKRVMPSLSLIRTYILDRVGPMDTTHNISMGPCRRPGWSRYSCTHCYFASTAQSTRARQGTRRSKVYCGWTVFR